MPANGRDVLDALERAMDHCFRDRALLLQALTHASFANESEDAEDNETLEFLGDSILNFLVTEKLFAAFPLEGEGTLSKARSLLVSEEHFAALARRVGLGPLLRLSPGEERAGGRERDARLADAFEAVFAALLLDGGIEAARAAAGRLFDADVAALDLGDCAAGTRRPRSRSGPRPRASRCRSTASSTRAVRRTTGASSTRFPGVRESAREAKATRRKMLREMQRMPF